MRQLWRVVAPFYTLTTNDYLYGLLLLSLKDISTFFTHFYIWMVQQPVYLILRAVGSETTSIKQHSMLFNYLH